LPISVLNYLRNVATHHDKLDANVLSGATIATARFLDLP
jgi:hypothetical protein